eukprot:TRINITY_DN13653_c1_g1_i6.p1 TRINITY_DN13653_c1_g1~~TRINITY_DN13653_c1_g1_i6.p1  ORF type:complete len:318 (-),score=27.78 TRINITY_DN13653_c1_g1_i6:172-1125(-)
MISNSQFSLSRLSRGYLSQYRRFSYNLQQRLNSDKSADMSKVLASKSRGALIVFEGVDRSGKSTQAKMLVEYLKSQGASVELWKFPDRTTVIGKMIDSYLKCDSCLDDKVVHLLFATNRWEKKDLMLKKLLGGTTLVVDRYSYSGVAFSAAKNLKSMSMEWCKAPEVGLPCPDMVLFMQLPLKYQAKRKGFGEERYENIGFQKKVAECFESLKDENWFLMDGMESVESIHQKIVVKANKIIEICKGGKSLRQLWDGEVLEEDFESVQDLNCSQIQEKHQVQEIKQPLCTSNEQQRRESFVDEQVNLTTKSQVQVKSQ